MIIWKDGELQAVFKGIQGGIDKVALDATKDMADALLILSRAEVPHDEGTLQASGHVEIERDGSSVVYNTRYAAYQHEGVRKDGTRIIRKYQRGRKGKYLEDPMRMNLAKWREIARRKMMEFLNTGK